MSDKISVSQDALLKALAEARRGDGFTNQQIVDELLIDHVQNTENKISVTRGELWDFAQAVVDAFKSRCNCGPEQCCCQYINDEILDVGIGTLATPSEAVCVWEFRAKYPYNWVSDCGYVDEEICESPADVDINYCPSCGKPVQVKGAAE